MPLRRARERIRHQGLDRRSVQELGRLHHLLQPRTGVGIVLVLVVDLVVQERRDQTARGARSTARLALVTPHRIIRVQRSHAVLVQAAEDGVHVVREEALVVQDVAEALGASVHAHLLVVLVLVHFDDGVEALLEGVAVGGEAHDREDDLGALVVAAGAADAEEFGGVARVDVVAAGAASVAGEDGEVGAGDAEGCAAVVCVAVEDVLAG
ncbi:2039_t:CDS:1, partial [Scutellospora calospora]